MLNHLATRGFGLKVNLNMLKGPVNKKKYSSIQLIISPSKNPDNITLFIPRWIADPTQVNAFYYYLGNALSNFKLIIFH